MADLLAELRGDLPKVPHFSVVLPAGWGEFEPSESVQASFTSRARERLMRAHRPDLYAELLGMTKRAFADMDALQTLKFYVQTEAWAEELFLPMSLTATLRRESAEVSLQAGVVDLIRRYQATPLGDDRRFVRWESESVEQFGSESVAQFTVSYLTPVPGSGHTQALQFNAVALMPNEPGLTRAEPLLTSMFELTDAMVSTLTWDTP